MLEDKDVPNVFPKCSAEECHFVGGSQREATEDLVSREVRAGLSWEAKSAVSMRKLYYS